MEETIHIDGLAFGGSGVGRLQGKVVFVPQTAPGDEVCFRVQREKKHFIEGELVSVLAASPERREPPCPVFGQCGGCQWQHLPYERQIYWKQQIFADFLSRHLGLPAEIIKPFATAPAEWGYRSRMQFKCRQTAAGFVAGFYRRGSHFVIDVDFCPIASPPINEALRLFRQWLAKSPCPAQIPQLDIAVDDEGRLAAVVHCLAPDLRPLVDYLEHLAIGAGYSLYVQRGRKNTLQAVANPTDLYIHPLVEDSMRLAYPVGGFSQVNLVQNRRLVADVVAAAQPLDGQRVLDLYCGMGNFSLPLTHYGAQTFGVEDYAPAIDCARRNAQANRCAASFFSLSAQQALTGPLRDISFDLILLDPPRSGAREVVPELLKLRPPRILYVSCDPATLVRDLKPLLHNGYRVNHTRAIDLFPQTYHMESLTCLERI